MCKICAKVLIIIILFSGPSVFGQKINFKLSNYKLPEYKRELFDFKFNFNGSHRKSDYFNNYDIYGDPESFLSLQNNIDGVYNLYVNSSQFQKERSINMSLPLSYQKFNTSEQLNTTPHFEIENIHRRFLKRNDYFETNFNANIGGFLAKRTSQENQKQINAFIELPFKYGNGRIEEVQDARQAVYLFQEFQNANILNQTVNDEDIIKLATQISKLKKERYYDSRIQKIHELEIIDVFLKEHNYISENNIGYFAVLNDMWDYGRNQIRKSGNSAALAIYPGIGALKMTSGSNSQTLITPSISGGFELNAHKPLSLKVQSNTEFKALGGYMQWKDTDSEQKAKLPHARLSFYQDFGIYPNTRTDFNVFTNLSLIQFIEAKTASNGTQPESRMMEITGGVNWNYYISERLRFRLDWQVSYISNDSDYYEGMPLDQNINQNVLVSVLENSLSDNFYYMYPVKEKLFQTFNISLIYHLF